jgi:hypothetical protein
VSITAAKVRAGLMRLCVASTRCLQPKLEGVQHRLMTPALAPQSMEVRRVPSSRAITASPSMRKDGAADAARSLNDGRETVAQVIAALREAPDAVAIAAHHQPVAVVLDFVDPQRAGRRLGHLRR